ncbi:hypothetical protein M407DRAFT_10953 [Tulasnella calospora MUT 4182]|uniref:Uncharacterized protein n=1 Tax=Tulasnella calospora MUT 4182 TaxID=1051891 RepID=A0A0C3KFQ4_9AGAM|nr:hypothetical protein M407DRAFT_10953 [Tulasnella calospora MUT 4182]
MSSTSSTEHAEGTASSSRFDRDLSFYTSLTYVLEPKEKSSALSTDALQQVVLKLDPKADLGAFTIRKVHPSSPEEERIRRHVTKWLASTASASNEESAAVGTSGDPPTSTTLDESEQHPSTQQDQSFPDNKSDVDEAGPSTPKEASAQEDTRTYGRRVVGRRAAPRQSTTALSRSSASRAPPVSFPSRVTDPTRCLRSVVLGKRAATSAALSDQDPSFNFDGLDSHEIHAAERPRKRVRFDLGFNTYKYFEEGDEPRLIPGRSNASGGAQLAPTINKLPPACLQRILIYGIPHPTSNSAKSYRSALHGLMSVCSKWKRIAESTPPLWSHLSNTNPPAMLDACIQRSTSIAITVHFDGAAEFPSIVQSALERFVDKVAPLRLRWKSVRFNDVPPTWSSYLAVARAFNGPAPALVSANVTTIYGNTMPFVHSLRFFGGDAQALRHVTLTGIVPELSDVPIFANIVSLRIIRPMGISPAYVLRMLARNNKLRSLELVEVRPSYARLFQNVETLELPELLHFKLHLLNENTVEMGQLFTRLRAPKCCRLDLAIDIDHLKNLRLEFNMFEFDMEAFLVDLGSWMSNWMALNRASSVEAWVDPTPGGESSKPSFCWQYGGAFNGSYRSRSADVRLEVENRRTKQIVSRWAEDVKLHAELVEAGVRRGVGLAHMESFRSYRKRLIKDREGENPEDGIQPHEFMGIWDLRNQANR